MGIVSLKCPSCGASLQLDNAMQNAFCAYCGGQIKVQQEIRNIKLDKSADLANLLVLIKEDLEAEDYDNAQPRIQKALEIDPENLDAWLFNLCCIGQCRIYEFEDGTNDVWGSGMTPFTLDQKRLAKRAAENVIKYGKGDSKYKKIINSFYIYKSFTCINLVQGVYSDVSYVHNRLAELEEICYPGQIAHWGQHEHEEIMQQEEYDFLDSWMDCETSAIFMLDELYTEFLGNVEYARLTDMAEIYAAAIKALNSRYRLYNASPTDEAVELRKQYLQKIKSLIPQSYVESAEALDKESSNEKEPEKEAEDGDSGSLFIIIGCIFMLVIIVLFILMCSL